MNLLFGQCHPELNIAIIEQLQRLTFVDQGFHHQAYDFASGMASSLLPSADYRFNFRLNDGSSAVECAVKMARKKRGRGRVLTLDGIYLGQNAQSLHFRGWGARRDDVLIGSTEDVIFAPRPRPRFEIALEDSADENGTALVDLIRLHHECLACVLLDPVMISSGVTYGRGMPMLLRRAQEACHEFGVPLIMDECQSFGWVPDGTMSKYLDLQPDIVVLGKSLAGGLPLAICAASPAFDNLEWGDADYTTGGSLVSLAAFQKSCEILGRSETITHIQTLRAVLEDCSEHLAHDHSDICTRGVGLIRAIQVGLSEHKSENAKISGEIAARCLELGLFIRTHEDCLTFKPPLVSTVADLRIAFNTLRRCIDEARRLHCKRSNLKE